MQVLYGGSPLSYACVFGLKRLVAKLLETQVVSFESGRDAISGLLPLHAVAANGLYDMYDFLRGHGAGGLPAGMRPNEKALSGEGILEHAPHACPCASSHVYGMCMACV